MGMLSGTAPLLSIGDTSVRRRPWAVALFSAIAKNPAEMAIIRADIGL